MYTKFEIPAKKIMKHLKNVHIILSALEWKENKPKLVCEYHPAQTILSYTANSRSLFLFFTDSFKL